MHMNEKQKHWDKPVNRIGRITTIAAMITSFLPFLYVVLRYDSMPSADKVVAAIGAMASAYAALWIVEPISYFPSLGTAGTYMGVLGGSLAGIRVPAALVAKDVAGTEEGSQEAEIVATCGIAGSVFMNLVIVFLTAVAGSAIIAILPAVVLNAMAAYVTPAIFGAVLGMFTYKGRLQLTIPVFFLSLLLNLLSVTGVLTLPYWLILIITVAMGIAIARLEYVKGWAK